MKIMKVKITFTEEVLGSAPSNEEIYADFIASKAPDAMKRAEEIEAVGAEGLLERSMTIFPKDEDDNPFVYDYQIKGLFKDACGLLRKTTGSKSSKLTAYKKVIDGQIFPGPRRIYFQPPKGKKNIVISECQRPLRASTPQGERSALAISETIPAGSSLTFNVVTLKDDLVPTIKEWFAYGKLHGFGQWRNSGKGRFDTEILEVKDGDLADVLG